MRNKICVYFPDEDQRLAKFYFPDEDQRLAKFDEFLRQKIRRPSI